MLELQGRNERLWGKGVRMNTIRWFFFLALSILMVASCNNAAAEFHAEPPGVMSAQHQIYSGSSSSPVAHV